MRPMIINNRYWIAKAYDLIPPVVEQPKYNMFTRDNMEKELKPMFEKPYCIGTTTWSPLDAGFLTGKYADGIPKDSRLGDDDRLSKWYKFLAGELKVKGPIIAELMGYAKKLDTTVLLLALAWVLKNKNVSVCLLGGKKSSQIESNMACIGVAKKLDDKIMAEIDGILKNAIPFDRNANSRMLKKVIDAK